MVEESSMGEGNAPISRGRDNRTANLLGSGTGSLASSTRYWYIDNKGILLEEMGQTASYHWSPSGAFLRLSQGGQIVDLA